MTRVRLASVQTAPVFLDLDASVDKMVSLIKAAGEGGANIVGFPEGCIPAHPIWYHFYPATSPEAYGFSARLAKNSIEIPSPQVDRLCEAARAAGVFAVIGVCEREIGRIGTLYNTLLFIDESGTLVGRHRKLVPTVGERLVHTPGDLLGMRAYSTSHAKVSGLLCGENSNPLSAYYLDAQGTNIHVASWPSCFTPGQVTADIVSMTTRAFAYQTKSFVINAMGENSPAMLDELPANESHRAYLESETGGSTIIGPTGAILAGPAEPGEQIIYADVTLDDLITPKLIHDFAGHYNRFDIFRLEVMPGNYSNVVTSADGDGRSVQGNVWQTGAPAIDSADRVGLREPLDRVRAQPELEPPAAGSE